MRNDDTNPFAVAFGCVFMLVSLAFLAVFYGGGWLMVLTVVTALWRAVFGGHQP